MNEFCVQPPRTAVRRVIGNKAWFLPSCNLDRIQRRFLLLQNFGPSSVFVLKEDLLVRNLVLVDFLYQLRVGLKISKFLYDF